MDKDLEDVKQHSNALAARIVADVDESISRVEAKIDKLYDKIDGYGNRITTNEGRIEQLRGFSRVLLTILLAVAGFFANAYLSLFGKH